jgi:putative ABC transport system substrate-binding protein
VKRRHFISIAALGCASPALLAQMTVKPRKIGTLAGGFANAFAGQTIEAFRGGMRDLGYVEGRDYVLETRFAEGQYERFPALAVDLVKHNVDIIVTIGGTPATRAAQQATQSIPIVMAAGTDPVAMGLVKSLARPGGNVTGITNFTDLIPKHVELITSAIPRVSYVAVVINPGTVSNARTLQNINAIAKASKVRLTTAKVHSKGEIEPAFAAIVRDGVQAIAIASDPLLNSEARQLAELALKHRLPSIAEAQRYIEAGGLMSYGERDLENFRRAAYYVDRILKGAKPGDLPIEQPTKLDFGVNLKTAKALGITFPQSLLVRADKVIE